MKKSIKSPALPKHFTEIGGFKNRDELAKALEAGHPHESGILHLMAAHKIDIPGLSPRLVRELQIAREATEEFKRTMSEDVPRIVSSDVFVSTGDAAVKRIPNSESSRLVIGMLYELPDGRVARTYGSFERGAKIGYYFDDDSGNHLADTADVVSNWKPREDLEDFPNARDPILPYEFDLFWDIKHRSQLVSALSDGHADRKAIFEAVARTGVELGDVPAVLKTQLQAARARHATKSGKTGKPASPAA